MIDKDYASDESENCESKYKRMLKQTTAMAIFKNIYIWYIHIINIGEYAYIRNNIQHVTYINI